jgi:putative ABC transport system substrate-binding protein
VNRREFITLVGGAAATWPLAAHAQQAGKLPTVGFLGGTSGDLFRGPLTAFRGGLGESGYVEGSSITIEYRWAAGRNDVLSLLVADLVAHRVDVIATTTTPGALAAKVATSTIPIVFAIGSDPVRDGLVSSLNRPGGNVTGATALTVELGPKRLELLHELLPASRKVALLVNPTNATLADEQLRDLPLAARQLGLELHRLDASTEAQIEDAFADLARVRASALIVTADSLFTSHSAKIAAIALRDAVPTIYQNRAFAAAGGLLSYGGSTADAWRIAGVYVGRIL